MRMQLTVRYGNDLYCYNDCHEDGATVIVWEWLRTWCLLAMRNGATVIVWEWLRTWCTTSILAMRNVTCGWLWWWGCYKDATTGL